MAQMPKPMASAPSKRFHMTWAMASLRSMKASESARPEAAMAMAIEATTSAVS